MKLHKRLTVANKPFALVADNARLNLFTPGRAVFTIQATEAVTGVVVFSTGYDANQLKPWFIGFVETCTQVDNKQQRIFCRELSAALYRRLPLALRDATLADTLAAISKATALEFVLPGKNALYEFIKAPAFYSLANGYFAMDSLADVYRIDKPLWQQQADGKVWVGSWSDSHWASKVVSVPREWETMVTTANGATVPVFPALRPGAVYNGNVLTGVEFAGLKMNLTWDKNPWGNR